MDSRLRGNDMRKKRNEIGPIKWNSAADKIIREDWTNLVLGKGYWPEGEKNIRG